MDRLVNSYSPCVQCHVCCHVHVLLHLYVCVCVQVSVESFRAIMEEVQAQQQQQTTTHSAS